MSDEPMSKAKSVKMLADLGGIGDPVDAGHCHPSQARILVKKQLAKWHEGKLLVRLRPVHLAVAANVPVLQNEASEVSEADVKRRTHWLRTIIQAVVNSDTHGSDLDGILRFDPNRGLRVVDPRDGIEHILVVAVSYDERFKREADNLAQGKKRGRPAKADDVWYEEGDVPEGVSDEQLMQLWRGAPYVGDAFGSGGTPGLSDAPKKAGPWEYVGPVYTPEDVRSGGIFQIAVPFPKCGGARNVPKDVWVPVKCATCGQGQDTDGDGNCPMCKAHLQIPTR